MATAQTMTTEEQLKGLYPDAVFPYQEAAPMALLSDPRVASFAAIIEGDAPRLRVPFVKTPPTAGFVREGMEIPDGGGWLDEISINTGKLALIVCRSNESTKFNTATQLVSSGISTAMSEQADWALLNNPKAADPDEQNGSIGLLLTEGMVTVTAGNENDIVAAVADAKAQVGTNGGIPTAILCNYNTEADLRKLWAASGYVLADATRADAISIHGVPVIVNKAMPDNKLFMVSAHEIPFASTGVQMATSSEANFLKDGTVYRATWRFGAKIVHPNRCAIIEYTKSTK